MNGVAKERIPYLGRDYFLSFSPLTIPLMRGFIHAYEATAVK